MDRRMDRSYILNLMLHQRLAQRLNQTTLRQWTPRLMASIERTRSRTQEETRRANIARWRKLIQAGDVKALRILMVDISEKSVEMREVSPFGGVVSPEERDDVVNTWKSVMRD